jgi:membrane protein DedA with SNARE-associated domain
MIMRWVKLATAGFAGGALAVLLGCALLVGAGLPIYESAPRGYMNPSAAVGESVANVLVAFAVFAAGAAAGILVTVLIGRRVERRAL